MRDSKKRCEHAKERGMGHANGGRGEGEKLPEPVMTYDCTITSPYQKCKFYGDNTDCSIYKNNK